MTDTSYVGRFAPSPTGPLHLGSLVAALASFLDARSNNGKWLVRIEDIDPPREVAGATDSILAALDQHGLHWDNEVVYQSQRTDRYESAIAALDRLKLTFACSCSRQQLQDYPIYPGTCRRQPPKMAGPSAIRLNVDGVFVSFDDLIQGKQSVSMEESVGDFVIRRKDRLFSYQLAVAIDDHAQQISRVVRGADLLDSSFKQITILRMFGAEIPEYAHLPIIVNSAGEKLSKQTHATALATNQASLNLEFALSCLGHTCPPELSGAAPELLLSWAENNWQLSNVPGGTHSSLVAS